MRILIDGDGCPVVAEITQLAEIYQIPVKIITSYAHHTDKYQASHVSYIFVDSENQMADYKIASMMEEGDLLITQDYGLASLVLHKGRVLHHAGFEYTQDNIDGLLNQRHLHAVDRRKSAKYTKIPQFTLENRQNFYRFLENIIQETNI